MNVTDLKGVGEASAKLLKRLGIETPLDLLENVPRAYDDYSKIQKIRSIKPGTVTIKAQLTSINARYSKKGLHMTEALASDETGSVRVTWFNQPYRGRSIKADEEYYISGEYAGNYKYLTINNPVCELVSRFPLHTARLVPRYRLTKGLSVFQMRKFTKAAFEHIKLKETLPKWLIKEKQLIGRKEALFGMHFPKTIQSLSVAKRRIAFDELFEITLASELNKREYAKASAVSIPFAESVVKQFVNTLPYTLTNDQRKAAWQILQDMTQGRPMNRLVEGDVGSGKTVVAALSMVNAVSGGFQVALMAPTEILAAQHAQSLYGLLPDAVAQNLVFLSGSMTKKQKELAYGRIKSGEAQVIVGTHALIQAGVEFKNLGLAVIDEQHRFGVEQRKKLQSKAKTMPHILNMTATPIPRSLMLTLYGEMDASIIAQMPPGRTSIATKVVQPEQRKNLYEKLRTPIDNGRQIFVVCPLIEESLQGVKPSRSLSVVAIHKQLTTWFKGYRVGLLHGKLKPAQKEQIMKDFIARKYDVLVSTTVIEVGVDVPNASVMVIEGADRFGLAQIHQLRGRVGRGEHAGSCYLILADNGSVSKRLQMLEKETNGFKLAEYDLELRGPGAIYGTMQHGELDLRVAKITDIALISEARQAARQFIKKNEDLLHYPQLKIRVDHLRKITNLN